MQLVIGNKNYSSWSLRAWFILAHFELEFEEIHESLNAQKLSESLGKHSPSSKVPVLKDGGILVWDSLAICEYINETYLDGRAWPKQKSLRAHARSIAAEMHASFSALRTELPMNCRARRCIEISSEAKKDIAYIDSTWVSAIEKSGGPWLFGDFSIADCFYAPVVMRFVTYGIALSQHSQAYVDHLIKDAHIQRWLAAARAETELVSIEEVGEEAH